MNLSDIDTTLHIRRIPTPASSFLLLPHSHRTSSTDLRSRQPKSHESKTSSYTWRRYSEKMAQINSAPDVAYRNTYLKTDKSDIHISQYHSRLPSTPPMKFNSFPSERSQSNTIYDYIRDSIRQIEHQRQLKRDLSLNVKRPQNNDHTFQQLLVRRRSSTRMSHLDFATPTNSKTIVNYLNHVRLAQLTKNNANQYTKCV
ncbi:unnamed protein product [Adineta ricciae]|uniref:Uncharacterized protein n=1 Tax=Adineta ricciae TaxID=249248 RepID=A0A813Y4D6_ADIRI|nr:unnamed protein product [Adineta ricciae]CAF0897233.1 unnamed protein product [Adineta ricciae]